MKQKHPFDFTSLRMGVLVERLHLIPTNTARRGGPSTSQTKTRNSDRPQTMSKSN